MTAMFRKLAASLALAASLPAAAPAQTDGYDYDTLIACSIVYGRISQLYIEQGNVDEGMSFQSTTNAYSAAAYEVLKPSFDTEDNAFAYSQARMSEVVANLNAQIESKGGEMGVIEEWLPYCDTLGAGVTQIVSRANIVLTAPLQ